MTFFRPLWVAGLVAAASVAGGCGGGSANGGRAPSVTRPIFASQAQGFPALMNAQNSILSSLKIGQPSRLQQVMAGKPLR